MQIISKYICNFCGESNITIIDLNGGIQQKYIENCQFCRKPSVLDVKVDKDTLEVKIDTVYKR